MNEDKRMDPCERLMQFFESSHLREDLQFVVEDCHLLAQDMLDRLPHNPELTIALRELIRAKDSFVRTLLYKE